MERKALGKGISALIPEKEIHGSEQLLQVPIEKVRPNPLQPREYFDAEEMESLVHSIKEKGIIQPVLVRPKGDYYELIAGERRLRAAVQLHFKEIPVIIKNLEDQNSLELSLIENVQRQNLNPIEEAHAYQYLIDKFQVTQEKISEALGKSRATIANLLRILKLPQEIQEEIKKGRITFAHGKAILEVQDPNDQRVLSQAVIARGLSVRELENLIRAKRPRKAAGKKITTGKDPFVSLMEAQLQQALATRVRVVRQKKRGHIQIEFYSDEDLQRIVALLKGG
ncbi:MAG: ParB/RepB/Spo0J family partition protein [Candidatus Omnitrophica bacterium]|nr:ParB/RepB/Spo0J family partition protein [Candidatus Omnitrophota bacterium]MDD5565733.1 ParB/RepB/Spo0J family partition protein [Candidatus Omnitrophota bacterium]